MKLEIVLERSVRAIFISSHDVRAIDITANLSDIDGTSMPLCEQSGADLKKKYYDARPHFTNSYQRRARCGQNNPQNFDSLCPTGRDAKLNATGKRILIVFVALQCGTAN